MFVAEADVICMQPSSSQVDDVPQSQQQQAKAPSGTVTSTSADSTHPPKVSTAAAAGIQPAASPQLQRPLSTPEAPAQASAPEAADPPGQPDATDPAASKPLADGAGHEKVSAKLKHAQESSDSHGRRDHKRTKGSEKEGKKRSREDRKDGRNAQKVGVRGALESLSSVKRAPLDVTFNTNTNSLFGRMMQLPSVLFLPYLPCWKHILPFKILLSAACSWAGL